VTCLLWYSWNIVESGVKHHNSNPYFKGWLHVSMSYNFLYTGTFVHYFTVLRTKTHDHLHNVYKHHVKLLFKKEEITWIIRNPHEKVCLEFTKGWLHVSMSYNFLYTGTFVHYFTVLNICLLSLMPLQSVHL
jgi:hypothetical protein